MGFIAALFLIYMRSEEIAFWAFIEVMYEKGWRNVYKEGTPKLITLLDSFDRQFNRTLPRIAMHLAENQVPTALCFSQVFTTIFIYDVPMDIAVRIIDVFLYDGEHILFKILLNMLQLKEKRILEFHTQELLNY